MSKDRFTLSSKDAGELTYTGNPDLEITVTGSGITLNGKPLELGDYKIKAGDVIGYPVEESLNSTNSKWIFRDEEKC